MVVVVVPPPTTGTTSSSSSRACVRGEGPLGGGVEGGHEDEASRREKDNLLGRAVACGGVRHWRGAWGPAEGPAPRNGEAT